MHDKTNLGLVAYAKAQLGLPYWFGTFGQTASRWILDYNRKRFPGFYLSEDFDSQIGLRVHDCIGLVKGFLWSDSPTSPPAYCSEACEVDYSADDMLRDCKVKGSIATLPELPGALLFMKGHVGVYIGGGMVIEARGHAWGVVQTPLMTRPWQHWGKCPYIEYVEEDDDMKRYEKIAEIPNDWGARDVIYKLMDAKIIQGDGSDPDGNNDVIDLSHDMVRTIVTNYRGGAYDRALIAAGLTPAVQLG